MCESYLGADIFRAGIQLYQTAYKNKNAAGADLWSKLSAASDQPVGDLMQSWITQSGFPLVTVTQRQKGDQVELHLSQRRFFANAQHMGEANPQRWMIPMVIRYDLGQGSREHRARLDGDTAVITLPGTGRAKWVYPNADATGFFRLHLDNASLAALLKGGLGALTPAERMSLLSDQWALVRCGLAHIESFMEVLRAFAGEQDHAVLRTLTARLEFLQSYLVAPEDTGALAALARVLLGRQLDALGWEPAADEPQTRAVQRALVIDALGEVGRDADVLAQAARWVDREMEDPRSVDPNLAGVLIALAALDGDAKRLERYVTTYTNRKTARMAPELQARYLNALSAFERPEIAKRVLDLCLDGTVPQEQLRVVLSSMLSRRANSERTWEFLKKHWKALAPRVGAMGLSRLVESTGSLPYARRDDVADFFTKNP
ncbi:MAG TPA: M1 family metallopeptidase, partial [Myxococcota bacterium]|nr:M1 family metallopeptidase [Myxococcota bacterium]